MHPERTFSQSEALEMFDREIERLGLRYRLEFMGNSPQTVRCYLLQNDDSIIDVGNGKGVGIQSELSAKYEALEHYLTTKHSDLHAQYLQFSFHELENNLTELNKKMLPFFLKQVPNRYKTTAWVYLDEYDQKSSLIIPYFLVNPDDLKVPVFLAMFSQQNYSIPSIGLGASLSSSYALERAVLEALQSFHLYDKDLQDQDTHILNRFSEWPILKKCAKLDLISFIKNGWFTKCTFSQSVADSTITVNENLSQIFQVLTRHNLQLFTVRHYQSKNGLTCLKSVIPGLEQFHLVRHGNFVIPGDRGRIALNAA